MSDFPYPHRAPLALEEHLQQLPEGHPLRLQFLPQPIEVDPEAQRGGLIDPIGDQLKSQGGQLIHRYPSRILFTPTAQCPVHCRYCFRKNELSQPDQSVNFLTPNDEQTLAYLNAHPEIKEVIFSGGDPFSLPDSRLDHYLQRFSKISHLRFIRFHTRFPAVLPQRFSDKTIRWLQGWKRRFDVTLVTHTNHRQEWWSPDHLALLEELKQSGLRLLTQTVLLKGVNNHLETLLELFHFLLEWEQRPYYLHHPDAVKGAMHFRIEPQEGVSLYRALRPHLPGWALPHYVIDDPDAQGKKLVESLHLENHF